MELTASQTGVKYRGFRNYAGTRMRTGEGIRQGAGTGIWVGPYAGLGSNVEGGSLVQLVLTCSDKWCTDWACPNPPKQLGGDPMGCTAA